MNSQINQLSTLELPIDIPKKGDSKIKPQIFNDNMNNNKSSTKPSSLETFVEGL